MSATADLLAGPAGITCTACGAVLPSGAAPAKGHAPHCPTAARWVAEATLGGTPASLAAGLARDAHAAGGAAAVAAVAAQLEAMAAALRAGAGGGR